MKRLIAELSLMREHVTPAQRRVLERAIKEIVELTDAWTSSRIGRKTIKERQLA